MEGKLLLLVGAGIAALGFVSGMARLTACGDGSAARKICRFGVLAWFAAALWVTILSRSEVAWSALRLNPLRSLKLDGLIGNVLLFLPFGGMLRCLGADMKHCAAAGLGVSLLIETTQLLTRRGIADVNDLLANTLGAVLGAWLLMRGIRYFHHHTKQKRTN